MGKKKLNMKRRKERQDFKRKLNDIYHTKTCKKTVLGASVLSSKPVEKKSTILILKASSLTIPLLLLSSQNKQKKISLNLSIADLKIYVSDRALNKCTQWND